MTHEPSTNENDPTQLWELHKQIKILQTQSRKVSTQIRKLQLEMRKNSVAVQAVQESSPDVNVYKVVARAFILKPKETLLEELELQSKDNLKETNNLQELEKQFAVKLANANTKLSDFKNRFKVRSV